MPTTIMPGSDTTFISGSRFHFYPGDRAAWLLPQGLYTEIGGGYVSIGPTDDVHEGGQLNLLPDAAHSQPIFIDRYDDRFRVVVNNNTIANFDANGIFSEVAVAQYGGGDEQAKLSGTAASAEDETPFYLRLFDDTEYQVGVGVDDSGGTGLAVLVVPNQGVT